MRIRNYKDKFLLQKTFIVTILIILVAFFLSVHILLQLINNFFITDMENDSISITRNYVNRIADATESLEIINNMLDEKLMVTVKSIANSHHNSNISELIKTAYAYNIDEINIFNEHGEVFISNNFQHIGWTSYEGHPTYFFMTSFKKTWLEDIRKDTLSDTYYKYGYYKADDGCFVQVGIIADKYYNLIEAFEITNLINELDKFNYIISAHFIDNDLKMVACNNMDNTYEFTLDKLKKSSIKENKDYFNKTMYGNEDAYEVMLPVNKNGEKVGTLAITYSLSDTLQFIKLSSFVGIAVLFFVFTIIGLMMVTINQRNNKLLQLAYFDPLTELPNKDYLNEFLKDSLKKSVNKAILLINITNYNIINLTYGHEEGNKILKGLFHKIKAIISKNEKLFKISENQLVIYTEDYSNREYLIQICNKVNSLFESKTQNIPNNINSKIGIVEIDNSCDSTDEILRDVEIASSDEFINNRTYRFFNSVMEQKILRENYIENEIKNAIDNYNNNKIYLEYQPQLDLRTNKITGFEGLARMKTEKLGLLSPVEFIEIAEKRNLIIPLGLKLLKNACSFIKCIEKQGHKNVTVAVNISAIQILRDDFYTNVMTIIEEACIDPKYLEFELTESVFVDNYDIVNNNLMKLKKTGIKLSLDDFGTGYSSLARIKELNIDTIKIDKLFIDSLITSKPNEILAGDIISFAHRMGLNTIAEGVEHEVQKHYLTSEGCDIMQGFLFSKPISHVDALNILNRTNK